MDFCYCRNIAHVDFMLCPYLSLKIGTFMIKLGYGLSHIFLAPPFCTCTFPKINMELAKDM